MFKKWYEETEDNQCTDYLYITSGEMYTNVINIQHECDTYCKVAGKYCGPSTG